MGLPSLFLLRPTSLLVNVSLVASDGRVMDDCAIAFAAADSC